MKEPAIRFRPNRSGKKVYFIDYYTPEGDRKRITVGPRKVEAERVRAKIYHDQISGKFGLPISNNVSMSLKELCDLLLKSKENRSAEASIIKYRGNADHLLKYYKARFSSVKSITKITQAHLEEHLRDVKESGHKNSTVNGQIRFLKLLFNYAVDAGYLSESPARKLQKFKEQMGDRVRYWEPNELKDIFSTVAERWRDPIQFLYLTGLRKSELVNLTWGDVILDKKDKRIVIQSKEGWETKTSHSRRIPLSKDALAIINRCRKSKSSKWVFSGSKGDQISSRGLYDALKAALRKLGLTGNVHQLRHTFASHLVMNDVGIETVSRLLGHTDIKMTMRYAHLAPYHMLEAVNKLKL